MTDDPFSLTKAARWTDREPEARCNERYEYQRPAGKRYRHTKVNNMNKASLHETQSSAIANEIVALLTLCQQLQSAKDGREKPSPEQYSRDEDEFADQIRAACGHAILLRQLLPMMHGLSAIGAELEPRGSIHVAVGEDYAEKALNWLMDQYIKDKAS